MIATWALLIEHYGLVLRLLFAYAGLVIVSFWLLLIVVHTGHGLSALWRLAIRPCVSGLMVRVGTSKRNDPPPGPGAVVLT